MSFNLNDHIDYGNMFTAIFNEHKEYLIETCRFPDEDFPEARSMADGILNFTKNIDDWELNIEKCDIYNN
jgi:hypothetical protein